MSQKWKISRLVTVSLAVLVAAGIATFFVLRNHYSGPATITGYEDADGWIYQCSQPIAAKKGTATTIGHAQGSVPKDLAEANQYCYKTGIE